MDNMNIGAAITQDYSKSKPSWILKTCSGILRVFVCHRSSDQFWVSDNLAWTLNVSWVHTWSSVPGPLQMYILIILLGYWAFLQIRSRMILLGLGPPLLIWPSASTTPPSTPWPITNPLWHLRRRWRTQNNYHELIRPASLKALRKEGS